MEDGASAPRTGLLLIGWREYVNFPDWNVRRIKVKIDTGARTSALDVAHYQLRQVDGRGLVAELHLALKRKKPSQVTVVHAPVQELVSVRNTSGQWEQRPVIETTVRLGPLTKRIRLTITNRATMCFRMILGRKALEGDFLVDVSQQYLLKSSP